MQILKLISSQYITKISALKRKFPIKAAKLSNSDDKTYMLAHNSIVNIAKAEINYSFFKNNDGEIARKMNKNAINMARNPYKTNYPRAIDEDLRILTSNAPEDISKTCVYQDLDGRIFNLIETSRTQDGKINLRILDKDGAFIKTAQIPKAKIIMIDASIPSKIENQTKKYGCIGEEYSHCNKVSIYLKRTNPFADIETLDITDCDVISIDKLSKALEKVVKKVDDGEEIYAVNCSIAEERSTKQLSKCAGINLSKMTPRKKKIALNEFLAQMSKLDTQQKLNYIEKYSKIKNINNKLDILNEININIKIKNIVENLNQRGIKVFISAGNNGSDIFSYFLASDAVQSVGSIDNKGVCSGFSSSRGWVKHYEVGEYTIIPDKNGYNISNSKGTDLAFQSYIYKKVVGKKPADLLLSKNELEQYFLKEGKSKAKLNEIFIDAKSYYKILKRPLPKTLSDKYLYKNNVFAINSDGYVVPTVYDDRMNGTSFAAPVRTAKYTLNKQMQGII